MDNINDEKNAADHHLLQSPIPEWLKTIAVITTVLMMIPVFTFVVNIGLTLRGSWKTFTDHIPFRFIVSGFFMYFLVSIQGTLQGLRSTNSFLHFSQWPVGHGSDSVALSFESIFDNGKIIFTQKCLPCHGGSGNAQGPYARHVVTQPANLHERILTYLPDRYYICHADRGLADRQERG